MLSLIKMFRSVPFRSVPFRSVPFRSVPFRSVPFRNFSFYKFLLKIILPLLVSSFLFLACNPNDGGPVFFEDVKVISAGYDHTAVIKTDGTLWVCGNNSYGKLANGESGYDKYSNILIQITAEPGPWKAVSTRVYHTAALKADGTIWSWGNNGIGQLGDGNGGGSGIISKSPVQEYYKANNWITVSTGYFGDSDGGDTVAIKKEADVTHSLWGWGWITDESKIPKQIGNITDDWKEVSVGDNHIAAIQKNGTLWTWGHPSGNVYGQLGDGTTIPYTNPKQITISGIANDDWATVSAGSNHTVAIKKNGTIWAWGDNKWDQLGYDTLEEMYSATPRQIGKDTNWLAVSAGNLHTMAIKTDGTLWAWGNNANGQLGSNTESYSHIPVQIGRDRWIAVSAGYRHTAAVNSDGILYAWGDNSSGQLGDGTTKRRATPTKVIVSAD